MVAVGPDPPGTCEHAVDRLREADAEPLHAASERAGSLGFDEEMHVVRMDAEVDDAKRGGRGDRNPPTDRREDVCTPKERDSAHSAHRYVDRMAPVVGWALTMRHAWREAGGLAAGAGAATAPSPKDERLLS